MNPQPTQASSRRGTLRRTSFRVLTRTRCTGSHREFVSAGADLLPHVLHRLALRAESFPRTDAPERFRLRRSGRLPLQSLEPLFVGASHRTLWVHSAQRIADLTTNRTRFVRATGYQRLWLLGGHESHPSLVRKIIRRLNQNTESRRALGASVHTAESTFRNRAYNVLTFSARGPFGPCPTLYETRCPS